MTTFLKGVGQLLEQNVLIRGLIASLLIGSICYMYIIGMSVPTELINITYIVIGFYFGGVTGKQIERIVKNGKAN